MKKLLLYLIVTSLFCSPVTFAVEDDKSLAALVKARDYYSAMMLLDQNADANDALADGATALAWAVYWNADEMVEKLLDSGADPDRVNDYGISPLMLACEKGNPETINRLLDARANPNVSQTTGITPLMMCVRSGNVDAVRLLLTHGADVNARESRRGQTALMWAASEQHLEVARLLTEYGAGVNLQTRMPDNFKPLQYKTYGVQRRDPTQPDILDENDIHPDPTSSRGGFTALMFAAREGDIDMTRLLVSAGADVNLTSYEYGNALVVAAENSHEDVAIYLLENGANPDIVDRWGIAPIHYALQGGIVAISMSRPRIPTDDYWLKPNMPGLVKALLEHDANPNLRMGDGIPAFNYPAFARTTGNSMPEIRQPGASPFFLASASLDVELMKLLMSYGADPMLSTNEGTTPLMVASGMGRQDDLTPDEEKAAFAAASYALELGNFVNASNQDGRTALAAAAYHGADSVLKLLVDNGADLNAQDRYGQTALTIAKGIPYQVTGQDKRFRRASRHDSSVELLLSLGAEN